MEDTNKLQSFFRSELNPLMIDIKNEKEIINKLMRSLQRLDKLWDRRLEYEEHLYANKRNYIRSGKTSKMPEKCLDALDNCSSTENNSSLVTSTIDTTNILDSATYTGTTSTITPSIPSTDNETTSTLIYNYDNNNNSQSFIYEEESSNFDETFLSTEDYDFIDTIQSPTFSGISLPSLFYDSSKYSSLPIPTLSDVYNSASVSSGLTISTQKSVSCQPISGAAELHLLAKDNSNSRLLIYVINLYIIFVWDPGIF